MASKKRQQLGFGGAPRVDLLPSKQRKDLVHERTMPKLLFAIVASAVVAGLIWAAGLLPVQYANQRAADAATASQEALTELASFAELQGAQIGISLLSAERVELVRDEVLFMNVWDSVLTALPSDVSLSTFTAELAGAEGAADTSLGGLCLNGIATFTFSVNAPDMVPAADLLDSLEGVEGYLCASVIDAVSSGDGASALTTVLVRLVVGEDARANRFAEGADS